jgi:hypothetical protein
MPWWRLASTSTCNKGTLLMRSISLFLCLEFPVLVIRENGALSAIHGAF